MFSVLFEVHPSPAQWATYLDTAKGLRPELERVEGFIDNIRYKSLTREGWILSLSSWRDEKSLVRWRTAMRHHTVQEKGRAEILLDYRLRVGQITSDTHVPPGQQIEEQRLDETENGGGTAVTLTAARRPPALPEASSAQEIATFLGLETQADGLAGWDAFDAVLTPGDLLLMILWQTKAKAEAFVRANGSSPDRRLRQVRIVRDYGMFDRREAPQYYPAVEKQGS